MNHAQRIINYMKIHRGYPIQDIFELFLFLFFIKSIPKLNLLNSDVRENTYLYNTILAIFHEKNQNINLKEVLTYSILPKLSNTNDENINLFFENSSFLVNQFDVRIIYEVMDVINSIPIEDMNNLRRFEMIEELYDSMSKLNIENNLFSNRISKELREFIIKIIEPKDYDDIADFTTGTGALILESYKEVSKKNDLNLNIFSNNSFSAFDVSKEMLSFVIFQSYFSGIKRNLNILHTNVITAFRHDSKKYFDKIFLNPPMNYKISQHEISSYENFNSANSDILFLESIINTLKYDGVAIAIVSPNLLFVNSHGHITFREYLVNSMDLKYIIKLPEKRYNTNVNSYLIVFKKSVSNDDVAFIDLTNISNKNFLLAGLDNQRYKQIYMKGLEILSNINNSANIKANQNFYLKVSKQMIRDYNYSLDFNLYQSYKEEEKNEPINNLINKMQENIEEQLRNLKNLKKSILINNNNNNNNSEYISFFKFKIGDLYDIIQGKPVQKELPTRNEKNIPFVQIADMTKSNGFLLSNTELEISLEEINFKGLRIIEPETLLLSIRGTIAIPIITTKKVCISSNIVALIPQNDYISPWYLLGWFLKNRYRFNKNSFGVIPALTLTEIRNTEIDYPENIRHSVLNNYSQSLFQIQNIKEDIVENNIIIENMANSLFNEYFNSKKKEKF